MKLLGSFGIMFLAGTVHSQEIQFQVQPGFEIKPAATALEVRFPMFGNFDGAGRLFVAESSGLDLYLELQKQTRNCRISVLEDHDGDGKYESSKVFIDKLVFPMGLVWNDGKLYVADPPELVTYEDVDGDGRAEKRSVILSGFGHSDNGSLHGLIFGPDGWLYMTMGNPDGYDLTGSDGSHTKGTSGALLRCRADGSGIETVSRGFENLVEIDFMPNGEMIGTDNWFFLPSDGVRDALVHLVEEGLYPLHLTDKGTAHLVSGLPLPPIVSYPAVAHSGITRYRGAQFPGGFRDNFFSAQHNTRKIIRHQFQYKGSTFTSLDEDFVSTDNSDFHPSDVLEDADGSLLILDTGSWYIHHCPTGRIRKAPATGGIYRVSHSATQKVEDPRGTKISWGRPSVDLLGRRLQDLRSAVRQRASDEFSKLGADAVPTLQQLILSTQIPAARESAIWALCRINLPESKAALRQLLRSPEFGTRALAARALGRIKDKGSSDSLTTLLSDTSAPVRLAAAEALASCGNRESVRPVIDALAREVDRFEEHALILVLHRWAALGDLLGAVGHSHPRIQKAAVILLDQLPHQKLLPEHVLPKIFSDDPELRRTAQSCLRKHPEWVDQTLPVLSALLQAGGLKETEKEGLREFLPAFLHHPKVAGMVSESLLAAIIPVATKIVILESMAQVSNEKVPSDWEKTLSTLLLGGEKLLQPSVLRTISTLQFKNLNPVLMNFADQEAQPVILRLEALRAGIRGNRILSATATTFLLKQVERTNTATLRLTAAEIFSNSDLDARSAARFFKSVTGDNMITPGLVIQTAINAKLDNDATGSFLDFLENCLKAGNQLSSSNLAALAKKIPEQHQARVAVIQRRAELSLTEQRRQLEELEPLLQGGDANRGHQIFLGKAACFTCHRVGNNGGIAGPDLTKIGAIRSGRDLLESVLMPSATFAQGYDTYSVTTRNTDTFTGINIRQLQLEDVIVIRDVGGNETRLPKSQVEKMERLPLSIMPEGLLNGLGKEDIRDLFSYLQSLK